ncbi:MAG: MBL fold metallo-hydrolase [Pseudomonadota bacterium]
MNIVCLGAARMVTGSCFRVDLDDASFLVDCGMFQGGRLIEQRNYSTGAYKARELSGIFITHAHIDHSGLVPRLAREGFEGPVFATTATCALLEILWLDAAHIQEMEAEWQTRKNTRRGRRAVEPLYEAADAEKAIRLLRPLELDRELTPLPGVSTRFVTAGHILGAASLHLSLEDRKGSYRVGFSGDLGRPGQLIIPDPQEMPRLDTVFMETTYGGRKHKSIDDSRRELLAVIQEAYRDKGKVVIPAFAVERTQEIIYTLARAFEQGLMPRDMPIFLDSPLAIKSTEIFRKFPDFFDSETKALLENGLTPMNLPNLKFTPTTEESQRINDFPGPAVIIAGSGMANAGRIKHHLKHNLWRPNCHVVIVGFQAQGSTGRRLVEGAERVKLFREDVAVKAKIHTIGGFSAHADQEELLNWLEPLIHPDLTVNLCHGEEASTMAFKKVAEERFPQAKFYVPRYRETLRVEPRAGLMPPSAEEPAARVLDIRKRLIKLEQLLAVAKGLDPEAAAAVETALEQAEKAAGHGLSG